MKSVNPYINFNGNAEEAFHFYQSVFGGEVQLVRFKDMENKMGLTDEEKLNKIAYIALPLGNGTMLMGDDGPAVFDLPMPENSNFSISLETESPEEVKNLFSSLSSGGEKTMEIQETEWAECFGMCTDPYGVKWILNYTGDKM